MAHHELHSKLPPIEFTPDELSLRIKHRAQELGFAKVGILNVQNHTLSEEVGLSAWINAGYHADMDWMVTHLEKRVNPASLMENTRSIVCLSINYYCPDETPNPYADGVKIARYARGTDYHDIIKKKLKQLLEDIQSWVPGVQGRPLTDSAPMMERTLAAKAGLGWIGKSGMLIHPQLGSYVFLAELLLNIELTADSAQVPNHCGSCTRCLDACPTDAFVEPSVIDANKCIAYWTIESRGVHFPPAIRKNLNNWVFGCDICQEVCPWNIKFAQPTSVEAFQVRAVNQHPRASTILNLTPEDFAEAYRKSPIKRTKREGLQRNVRQLGYSPE